MTGPQLQAQQRDQPFPAQQKRAAAGLGRRDTGCSGGAAADGPGAATAACGSCSNGGALQLDPGHGADVAAGVALGAAGAVTPSQCDAGGGADPPNGRGRDPASVAASLAAGAAAAGTAPAAAGPAGPPALARSPFAASSAFAGHEAHDPDDSDSPTAAAVAGALLDTPEVALATGAAASPGAGPGAPSPPPGSVPPSPGPSYSQQSFIQAYSQACYSQGGASQPSCSHSCSSLALAERVLSLDAPQRDAVLRTARLRCAQGCTPPAAAPAGRSCWAGPRLPQHQRSLGRRQLDWSGVDEPAPQRAAALAHEHAARALYPVPFMTAMYASTAAPPVGAERRARDAATGLDGSAAAEGATPAKHRAAASATGAGVRSAGEDEAPLQPDTPDQLEQPQRLPPPPQAFFAVASAPPHHRASEGWRYAAAGTQPSKTPAATSSAAANALAAPEPARPAPTLDGRNLVGGAADGGGGGGPAQQGELSTEAGSITTSGNAADSITASGNAAGASAAAPFQSAQSPQLRTPMPPGPVAASLRRRGSSRAASGQLPPLRSGGGSGSGGGLGSRSGSVRTALWPVAQPSTPQTPSAYWHQPPAGTPGPPPVPHGTPFSAWAAVPVSTPRMGASRQGSWQLPPLAPAAVAARHVLHTSPFTWQAPLIALQLQPLAVSAGAAHAATAPPEAAAGDSSGSDSCSHASSWGATAGSGGAAAATARLVRQASGGSGSATPQPQRHPHLQHPLQHQHHAPQAVADAHAYAHSHTYGYSHGYGHYQLQQHEAYSTDSAGTDYPQQPYFHSYQHQYQQAYGFPGHYLPPSQPHHQHFNGYKQPHTQYEGGVCPEARAEPHNNQQQDTPGDKRSRNPSAPPKAAADGAHSQKQGTGSAIAGSERSTQRAASPAPRSPPLEPAPGPGGARSSHERSMTPPQQQQPVEPPPRQQQREGRPRERMQGAFTAEEEAAAAEGGGGASHHTGTSAAAAEGRRLSPLPPKRPRRQHPQQKQLQPLRPPSRSPSCASARSHGTPSAASGNGSSLGDLVSAGAAGGAPPEDAAAGAVQPRDTLSTLRWCHVQHSRKQEPSLDEGQVRELVKAQLQASKPIRAPWYRDAAASRQQAQQAAAAAAAAVTSCKGKGAAATGPSPPPQQSSAAAESGAGAVAHSRWQLLAQPALQQQCAVA
eukprot:XP_001689861.1 predicted protein [Chlamydomonas reinhardtii]